MYAGFRLHTLHLAFLLHAGLLAAPLLAAPVLAQTKPDCPGLPDAQRLRSVVQSVVREGASKNGGMGNQEWAAIVNRDGQVCAIVFSGNTRSDQWPGSRVIAAEKANTANALSGRDYALSTANVYAAAQPGQSLYSLATSAPPNPLAVFGNPTTFGTPTDPMIGLAIGGIIVFAGGLPLYSSDGKIVGALGLSGDTSCTDHVIAWKVRHELHLDAVPMGPSPDHNDNLILDFNNGVSQSGFGHPSCKGGNQSDGIIQDLSKNFPTGPRGK
ncbi:MAG TPA: heme-binding protein [Terracidiphilus sp.]